MIVNIGLGDTGIHVVLDDGIDEYNPIRLVEMCNEARKLFVSTYIETLGSVLIVEDDDVEVDEE